MRRISQFFSQDANQAASCLAEIVVLGRSIKRQSVLRQLTKVVPGLVAKWRSIIYDALVSETTGALNAGTLICCGGHFHPVLIGLINVIGFRTFGEHSPSRTGSPG
jgi:hypothetical protein